MVVLHLLCNSQEWLIHTCRTGHRQEERFHLYKFVPQRWSYVGTFQRLAVANACNYTYSETCKVSSFSRCSLPSLGCTSSSNWTSSAVKCWVIGRFSNGDANLSSRRESWSLCHLAWLDLCVGCALSCFSTPCSPSMGSVPLAIGCFRGFFSCGATRC